MVWPHVPSSIGTHEGYSRLQVDSKIHGTVQFGATGILKRDVFDCQYGDGKLTRIGKGPLGIQ